MENYKTVKYPASRLATHDIGRLSRKRHHVAGFLEVDITEGRRLIRKLIRQGQRVSFMAWFTKEVSSAIENHPYMNAINSFGRRQVIFRDINLSVPVEKEIEGVRVPVVKLITETNKKSVSDIFDELEEGRTREIKDRKDYTLTSKWYTQWNRIFFGLPQGLRMIIWRLILRSPGSIQNNIGIGIITNSGAVGKNPGWILPKTIHNIGIGLGSIVKKSQIRGDSTEIRDILHLTVLVDHDVVDGLPAAKFIEGLIRNLEGASSLRKIVSDVVHI